MAEMSKKSSFFQKTVHLYVLCRRDRDISGSTASVDMGGLPLFLKGIAYPNSPKQLQSAILFAIIAHFPSSQLQQLTLMAPNPQGI